MDRRGQVCRSGPRRQWTRASGATLSEAATPPLRNAATARNVPALMVTSAEQATART